MEESKEIIRSVPKEAWLQLSKTACKTFEKLIYPLTATTEGIGRLIEIRFSKLHDEQKIIAAKCIEEAYSKVINSKATKNERVVVKPSVIYEALDNSDNQTDETIRSLWANLLANEFIEGSVHPEIARLLSKITAQDALILLDIAQKQSATQLTIVVLKALASKTTLGIFDERKSFNHIHLKNLGLINQFENQWVLSAAGRELMRCVSDPE